MREKNWPEFAFKKIIGVRHRNRKLITGPDEVEQQQTI